MGGSMTERPDLTPSALAAEWRQLMRAAENPAISREESETLLARADALLGRLAEGAANTDAAIAAEILFRGSP
jgi:hypothetical protein